MAKKQWVYYDQLSNRHYLCYLITHYLSKSIPLPEAESELNGLFLLISYAYIFKFIIALLDTPLLYIGVKHLKKYLGINDHDF